MGGGEAREQFAQKTTRRDALKRLGGATIIGGALSTLPISVQATRTSKQDDWPMFKYDTARTSHSRRSKRPRKSSRELWRTTHLGSGTSPAVVDGIVYHGSRNHQLYAYDVDDGSVLWASEAEASLDPSRPSVANGIVYDGDIAGYLNAFNAQTGDLLWRFDTGEGQLSSGAVVANGMAFFGSFTGVLYAVNATTGDEHWRVETGGIIDHSPAYHNGTVYISSTDRHMYAIDGGTGTIKWMSPLPGGDRPRGFAVSDGSIYVGGQGGFYALDSADGSNRWQFDSGWVTNSPTVSDRFVYFGSNRNYVYAVERKSGEEQWRFALGDARFDGIISSPALVRNSLYFGSYDHNIYALNAKTGTLQWAYDTGSELTGSPAVVNRNLYIGIRLGGILALG